MPRQMAHGHRRHRAFRPTHRRQSPLPEPQTVTAAAAAAARQTRPPRAPLSQPFLSSVAEDKRAAAAAAAVAAYVDTHMRAVPSESPLPPAPLVHEPLPPPWRTSSPRSSDAGRVVPGRATPPVRAAIGIAAGQPAFPQGRLWQPKWRWQWRCRWWWWRRQQ